MMAGTMVSFCVSLFRELQLLRFGGNCGELPFMELE